MKRALRRVFWAGFLGLIATQSPAWADAGSTDYFNARANDNAVPKQLDKSERQYFSKVFEAIHAQQWETAQNLLAEREGKSDRGVLFEVAKSELFLAANSPRVEMGPLLGLLESASDLPSAEQLGRLAEKRGATILPARPQYRQLASFAPAPTRGKPRSVNDGSAPAELTAQIQDHIVNDDPAGAQILLEAAQDGLSDASKTELRQRVAWSFYIENQDRSAWDMARLASTGSGSWVADAHWVAGLAAWRMNDCANAAVDFDRAARFATNEELRAAGLYWSARANMRCRRPDLVAANLQSASQYDETFYGLLSAEQLGLRSVAAPETVEFSDRDWASLRQSANVRRAIALVEINEPELADAVLRHQARIADETQHEPLLKLARDLSLVQTQMWLAHNGPSGTRPASYARFPSPKWQPRDGWRVDPALVYAHSLQESRFQTKARSPADARGLMQVLPGTARDMARANGESVGESDLYRPEVNLEYGQRYLEHLSSMPQTQGLLPKIIAAYNAGPAPIGRWNSELRDNGDPLLFIESIPYYETRAYVGIILRNYWMYEKQAGVASQSASGIAQGLWPKFPKSGKIELVQLGSAGGQ